MIPRTVQMAKEVAATFTAPQLKALGNIIYNGYATTGANTANKKGWQYKETAAAPVNLPSVTSYTPVLLGWTTNYMEYYTQLGPVPVYDTTSGDPTMFNYVVHSFTQDAGPVGSLCRLQAGQVYTPGTYTNVPTIGGSGTGATLNLTVDVNGVVTVATLSSAGSGYAVGDGLGVASPGPIGPGYGFAVSVCAVQAGVGGTTITNGGSGYTPGTYPATPLTGGSGSGATANVTVTTNATGPATAVLLLTGGTGYSASTLFSSAPTTASTGSGIGLLLSGSINGVGAVDSIILGSSGGSGYLTNDVVSVSGTSGTRATVRVTAVSPSGAVTGLVIVNPGIGYNDGDTLSVGVPGGTGFAAVVTSTIAPFPAGQPGWNQVPHRYFQNQVAAFVPPNNNSQAIPYSFIYPIADSITPPPIDAL